MISKLHLKRFIAFIFLFILPVISISTESAAEEFRSKKVWLKSESSVITGSAEGESLILTLYGKPKHEFIIAKSFETPPFSANKRELQIDQNAEIVSRGTISKEGTAEVEVFLSAPFPKNLLFQAAVFKDKDGNFKGEIRYSDPVSVAVLSTMLNELQSDSASQERSACPDGWLNLGPSCLDPQRGSPASIGYAINDCYARKARICSEQDLTFACLNRTELSFDFPDSLGLWTGDADWVWWNDNRFKVAYGVFIRRGNTCTGPPYRFSTNPKPVMISGLSNGPYSYYCCRASNQ
ncbi:MAG: hypothetical protein D6719_04075 [Candidatus Dadabacteria bacterium]|nr:MAG: hypothetical protein D6719_04075 [Candidatus Dadabacteria bacterium]